MEKFLSINIYVFVQFYLHLRMTDSISNVFYFFYPFFLSNSFSRLKLTCTNAKALQALFSIHPPPSTLSTVFILEHIVHAWQCSEVHLKCFRYSGLLMATIARFNNNNRNTHTHTQCVHSMENIFDPLNGQQF